jgi:hypothetical protein
VQPPVTPVRDHLTDDDVIGLIRDTSAVVVSGGCELLTGMDLLVAEDITGDLETGSVTRASYASLHGSATLTVTRELPWGNALLRPYLTLSDGVDTARFNLGAYFSNTPKRDLSEFPISYDVECQDILAVLADPVGDAYAVARNQSYLDAIENVLQARGVVKYTIDRDAAGMLLPTDRTWMFDESTTWLTIVNDLLGAIGYAGVWSDWDGFIRCGSYASPRQRAPEWTYDTTLLTSMLGNRTTQQDFYAAPNRWVFYRTNNLDGAAPVEGAGMYTYVNLYDGDTSVEQRGREITKVVGIDAADQTSLVAAAQRTIDADSAVPIRINASTFPNPLHWHFDVVRVEDTWMGPPVKVLSSQWTLPLDGSEMSHEWTVVE